MSENKKILSITPEPKKIHRDLSISDQIIPDFESIKFSGNDRLTFDGYKLRWHGSSSSEYSAFSGQSDLSARESVKEFGPTPQGLYAIDPKNIEKLEPSDDWGKFRVKVEPYQATVDRMVNCFKAVRTGIYIHGGETKGTRGCIEINDDQEETMFLINLKSMDAR